MEETKEDAMSEVDSTGTASDDDNSVSSAVDLECTYHPPCIIFYEQYDPNFDEDKVPGLGLLDKMGYIMGFYAKTEAFMDQLRQSSEHRNYFLDGFKYVPDDPDAFFRDPLNAWVEKGLRTHMELGVHQLLRASACIGHLRVNLATKQEIVQRVFHEYENAISSVNEWESDNMKDLFSDTLDDCEDIAKGLGSLVGVPLDDDHEKEMIEGFK